MSKLFVIPGHGAGDNGACENGFKEAERVRALAQRIKDFGGDNVTLADFSVDAYKSNTIGKGLVPKDHIVVELHLDSSTVKTAKGGHIIIHKNFEADNYDKALAKMISEMFPGRSEKIVGRTDLANVNRAADKGYNYRLIECCFISNADDIKKFNANIDNLAKKFLTCFEIKVKSVETTTNVYRVRKTWKDAGSQIGAYKKLASAKLACKAGFSVFDEKGNVVYSVPAPATIKVGSTVKLNKGAKTYTGGNIASFIYSRKHKVKEIKGDRAVITYLGIVIAAVNIKDLTLA